MSLLSKVNLPTPIIKALKTINNVISTGAKTVADNTKSLYDSAKYTIKAAASRKGKDVEPVWKNKPVVSVGTDYAKRDRVVIRAAVVRREPSLSAQQQHGGIPLPVGTQVVELEVSNNGFSFIRYKYGVQEYTGWVQTSYLGNSTPSSASTSIGTSSTVVPASTSSGGDNSQWSQSYLGTDYNDTELVMASTVDNYDGTFISSKDQYEEPFSIFIMPGYTPAKMTVINYSSGSPVSYSFEFLIGPTATAESNSNSLVPIRTGAGFFIARNGADLGRLILNGFLLESSILDERRLFLEGYYRNYMIDKYNAFHTYFNESTLFVDLEGFRYQCILQSLDLTRSSNSMFLYNYNMVLLILHQEPTGNIKRPATRYTQGSSSSKLNENVINSANLLNKALQIK